MNKETARREAIIQGEPAQFVLTPGHAEADPNPIWSIASLEEVSRTGQSIEALAKKYSLPADFVKAIVWIETTHGWYDRLKYPSRLNPIFNLTGEKETLRPMNVHVRLWKEMGVTARTLQDTECNLETGVFLLAEIWKRTSEPTPEKVATLYNTLWAEKVSTYGKTVDYYMRKKPWNNSGETETTPPLLRQP